MSGNSERKRNKFDRKRCAIPTVWCGKGNITTNFKNDRYYTTKGKRWDCLKKGIGVGMAKNQDDTLVGSIPYVGKELSKKFRRKGFKTKQDLLDWCDDKDEGEIENILRKCCKNKNKSLNGKAYNSTLLWLYDNGIWWLPACELLY